MKHRRSIMAQILVRTIKHHMLLSVMLLFCIIGTIVTGIMPPLVLEKLVNGLTAGENLIFSYAITFFIVTAIAGLFDAAKESLITIFGQKVTHSLRSTMAEKLYYLPASYFVKNEPGVTSSRFVNDVNTVETLFTTGVISMVVDGCKVISILVVIFVKSKGLGLLLLIVTPALLVFTRIIQKKMFQAQIDHRVAVGETNQQIPETITNIRTIHVFEKENYFRRRYHAAILKGFEAMERSNFYDAVYSPIIIIISAILVAVMMVCAAQGGQMQSLFGMTVGTAVAVITYVGKIFDPLESIGMEIQNIQSAMAGLRRIQEFMEENERQEPDQVVKTLKKTPVVQVSDLSFGYEKDQIIFQNLNLSIQEGEMVTITGRTGIGKSTLFKLFLGMYHPQKGSIQIMGVDAEQIRDADKRHIFGYVEQKFQMIPGTIRDQVSLKDPNIEEEQMIQALQLVGLWNVIRAQGNSLDTECTTGMFSQGQFQLLAIARAIVLNPVILLLDEITANLDSETEAQVMESLRAISTHRTVISISHRLYERAGGRKIYIDGFTDNSCGEGILDGSVRTSRI